MSNRIGTVVTLLSVAVCDGQPLDCVFIGIFESGPYLREDGT